MFISSGATFTTKSLSHTFRQIRRQTDIFQKLTNHVQGILKRVTPSKTGSRKFSRNQYFLLQHTLTFVRTYKETY